MGGDGLRTRAAGPQVVPERSRLEKQADLMAAKLAELKQAKARQPEKVVAPLAKLEQEELAEYVEPELTMGGLAQLIKMVRPTAIRRTRRRLTSVELAVKRWSFLSVACGNWGLRLGVWARSQPPREWEPGEGEPGVDFVVRVFLRRTVVNAVALPRRGWARFRGTSRRSTGTTRSGRWSWSLRPTTSRTKTAM
jgi:hypothetical protein